MLKFFRELYRVVGFEVEPKSIDSSRITVSDDGSCTIQNGKTTQKIDPKGRIRWLTFEFRQSVLS